MEIIEKDMTPFLIEAVVASGKINNAINETFEKYKFNAHRASKSSPLYKHKIFCDGDIQKQELCRKFLGILCYLNANPDYEDLESDYIKMLKGGWPGIYRFLEGKKNENISIREAARFIDGEKMLIDEITAIYSLFIYFQSFLPYTVDIDVEYNKFCHILLARNNFSPESFEKKTFSINYLSESDQKEALSFKTRIFDEYGPLDQAQKIYCYNQAFHPASEEFKFTEALNLVFDTENIQVGSLIDNIKLEHSDVNDICAIYFSYFRNKDRKLGSQFLVTALTVKFLCKAYLKVKDYFFENNQESLYIDLESHIKDNADLTSKCTAYEKEILSLKKEVNYLKKDYKQDLEKKNIDLQKEIESLKEQLNDKNKDNKELFALREFVFHNANNEAIENAEVEELLINPDLESKIKSSRILVIGGHESWHAKINSEISDKIRFLNGVKPNFAISKIKNYEFVFFNTVHKISHAVYEKAMNVIKNNDVSIGYLSSTNIDITRQEIYNTLE